MGAVSQCSYPLYAGSPPTAAKFSMELCLLEERARSGPLLLLEKDRLLALRKPGVTSSLAPRQLVDPGAVKSRVTGRFS